MKKEKSKKKAKEEIIIYYSDELNDEFSSAQIQAKKIDGNYKYIQKGFFKKFTHFFWYRIVALPIAFFYLKIKFRHKIVNKSLLKPYRKQGYFLYGNHTQAIADALIPTMICFPKDAYVIVHANNVSMPYLGRVTPSLGALPLPGDLAAAKNFVAAVETRVSQGHCMTVYPEAHIWPYYTKIRPFPDTSFRYPIKCGVPTFCFTNTYQKRKFSKNPRIVTYLDGPFFPDPALPVGEQKKELKERVYAAMTERSLLNTAEFITYIKREKKENV